MRLQQRRASGAILRNLYAPRRLGRKLETRNAERRKAPGSFLLLQSPLISLILLPPVCYFLISTYLLTAPPLSSDYSDHWQFGFPKWIFLLENVSRSSWTCSASYSPAGRRRSLQRRRRAEGVPRIRSSSSSGSSSCALVESNARARAPGDEKR